MSDRQNPAIASRKQPQQARSTGLVTAILQAAAQVLAREGAQRFTTARVAERAGVSVGSIYQYFPNKAAILFRLQSDEWQQTTALLQDILQDASRPPSERLRRLVRVFLQSECDEAALRIALDDAAPLYRDAPEARAAHASGHLAVAEFMQEALPHSAADRRVVAADLLTATLSAVGKRFSESPRSAAEIAAYAEAMADMFCAYLDALNAATAATAATATDARRRPPRKRRGPAQAK